MTDINGEKTCVALRGIASERLNGYRERLAALSPSDRTEAKALHVLIGVTENCADVANMDYYRGDPYAAREERIRKVGAFDGYLSYLDSLEGGEREAFVIYAASVSTVYGCFYLPAKEFSGDGAEERFVAKLKRDCARDILAKWGAWWDENGCVPCGAVL